MTDSLSRPLAIHIIERLGSAGVPPTHGVEHINVGNEGLLALLRDVYFEGLLKVGSAFKLVEAHYGGGKTHFLRVVQEMAWAHGFATALVELSPQECPYDNPVAVYTQVARRIRLRPEEELADDASGIVGLVRETVAREVADWLADEEGRTADDARWVLGPRIRDRLRRTTCESPSYRAAVTSLALAELEGDERMRLRIESWLLGENPPLSELRDLGINEAITRSNGFTMLRSLTQMVTGLGLAGTALLFDEVDRTLSVSSRRTEAIGDNLRQVIDLCGESRLPRTLFMYAVPPEFMRQVVPDYPALEQRLRSPVPFSERSPQSPIIPLDRLDLAPEELLAQLAARVLGVFEVARATELDPAVQEKNARRLAALSVAREFDVNHRRLFVKAWVALLQGQLVDGEHVVTPDQVEQLLVGQRNAVVPARVERADAFSDF